MAEPSLAAPQPGAKRPAVLVISYHYGSASATGGFRWHALARGLAEKGWTVHVLTSETHADAGADAPRIITVPPVESRSAVRRLLDARGRMPEPSAATPASSSAPAPATPASAAAATPAPATGGALRWLRSIVGRTLHGIDSLRTDLRWVHAALGVARGEASRHQYAAVVVSAPPMASLLIGRSIASEFNIPFVADYRDPWFFGAGPLRLKADPVSWAAAGILDRRVQNSATAIIHNTDRARRAVDAEFGKPSVRRTVIINGYDGTLPDVRPDPDCFRVLYGGWIHPYMDPQPLLRALGRLRERVKPESGRFVIEFLGSPREIGGLPLLQLANAAGLEGCVQQTDRLPRAEAITRQQRAAVLAALDYPHGNAVVMKFYDYAQMYGTMLLIGKRESALAEAGSRIGVPVIDPADDAALDARLQQAWERWRKNEWASVNDAEQLYARRHSIQAMHDLLRELTGR